MGVVGLPLREGPDAAVHSDFALHILQLVQKLLALRLLLFVLLGDLVELGRALLQLLLHEDELLFESDGLGSRLTELVGFLLQGGVLFLESGNSGTKIGHLTSRSSTSRLHLLQLFLYLLQFLLLLLELRGALSLDLLNLFLLIESSSRGCGLTCGLGSLELVFQV